MEHKETLFKCKLRYFADVSPAYPLSIVAKVALSFSFKELKELERQMKEDFGNLCDKLLSIF